MMSVFGFLLFRQVLLLAAAKEFLFAFGNYKVVSSAVVIFTVFDIVADAQIA